MAPICVIKNFQNLNSPYTIILPNLCTTILIILGENAQQIIDQSAQLKNNERLLDDRTQTCNKLKKELEESKDIINRLQLRISELEGTNQLLMDEYQASQLECTTKERELLECRKLSTQMETQVLQLKEREVEFMNRENEVYQIRNEERIRKQLEEAAKENKTVVNVERYVYITNEELREYICLIFHRSFSYPEPIL